jgi:coproporphyrinogen III oxidase
MRTRTSSSQATPAIALVEELQRRLVQRLEHIDRALGGRVGFAPVEWLRDGGRHGGGVRFEIADTGLFNRASANVSHVHYDDDDARPLRSATALSSIIHPASPRLPSLHLHISWTELRGASGPGAGSWRLMADLNPSIPHALDTARFKAALVEVMTRHVGADLTATALAEGERYFFIPALQRHRGVCHAYLERHATADADADLAFARAFGEAVIDVYIAILDDAAQEDVVVDDAMRSAQLGYHTAYLFQVLTLDRGTTSGLLVHNENDVGILGSLPGRIDRALLASWRDAALEPMRPLIDAIVAALPDAHPCPVDVAARARLAGVVRTFFKAHPEVLELQARGSIVPPTVRNHGVVSRQ